MAEFYINLFEQEDYAGTNRPHFKALFKLDGVDHECAFWPNKDGKKGLSGKAKPKVPYGKPKETSSNVTQSDADKAWAEAQKSLAPKKESVETGALPQDVFNDEVPF